MMTEQHAQAAHRTAIDQQVSEQRKLIESYLSQETSVNFRKARDALAKITSLDSQLTDEQRQLAEDLRERIKAQQEAFRAKWGELATARQLGSAANELVSLRKLLNDGFTEDYNEESVRDKMVDATKKYVERIEQKANELRHQAKIALMTAIDFVIPDGIDRASSTCQSALNLFEVQAFKDNLVEIDEEKSENKHAILGAYDLIQERVGTTREEIRRERESIERMKYPLEQAHLHYRRSIDAYEQGGYRQSLQEAEEAQAYLGAEYNGSEPFKSKQIQHRIERAIVRLGAALIPEIEGLLDDIERQIRANKYDTASEQITKAADRINNLHDSARFSSLRDRFQRLQQDVHTRNEADESIIAAIQAGLHNYNTPNDFADAFDKLHTLLSQRPQYKLASELFDKLIEQSTAIIIQKAKRSENSRIDELRMLLADIDRQQKLIPLHHLRSTQERLQTDTEEARYNLDQWLRANEEAESRHQRDQEHLAARQRHISELLQQAHSAYEVGDAHQALRLVDDALKPMRESNHIQIAKAESDRKEYVDLAVEQHRSNLLAALRPTPPEIALAQEALREIAALLGDAHTTTTDLRQRIERTELRLEANAALIRGDIKQAFDLFHRVGIRAGDADYHTYRKVRLQYAEQLQSDNDAEALVELLSKASARDRREEELLQIGQQGLRSVTERRKEIDAQRQAEAQLLKTRLVGILQRWNDGRASPDAELTEIRNELTRIIAAYRAAKVDMPIDLDALYGEVEPDHKRRAEAEQAKRGLLEIIAHLDLPVATLNERIQAGYPAIARLEEQINDIDNRIAAQIGKTIPMTWTARNPLRAAVLRAIVDRNNRLAEQLMTDRTLGYDKIDEHVQLTWLLEKLDARNDAGLNITRLHDR